jgi:hypothetical protein
MTREDLIEIKRLTQDLVSAASLTQKIELVKNATLAQVTVLKHQNSDSSQTRCKVVSA